MTMIQATPPLPPNAPMRSSRWAWLALLASIVVYPLAIVIALSAQEGQWWGDVSLIGLTLLPPIAAVVLGVQCGRTGNRLGALATETASAWMTLIVIFFVGANYVWTGESLYAPAALAITMALVVVGAIIVGWHRLWSRHPA